MGRETSQGFALFPLYKKSEKESSTDLLIVGMLYYVLQVAEVIQPFTKGSLVRKEL